MTLCFYLVRHKFSIQNSTFFRQHASDVRKNVANYHLTAKSETSSAASSSSVKQFVNNFENQCLCNLYFQISLSEIVEPVDYEDFLIQHYNLLSRDPLRSILDFPTGDVQVKVIPRKIRTVDHIVPTEDM